MSDADAEPPLPAERSVPPEAAMAGRVVVMCGLMLMLLVLYVGSWAFFLIDFTYQWGVWNSFDPNLQDALVAFYSPLILLYQVATGSWK